MDLATAINNIQKTLSLWPFSLTWPSRLYINVGWKHFLRELGFHVFLDFPTGLNFFSFDVCEFRFISHHEYPCCPRQNYLMYVWCNFIHYAEGEESPMRIWKTYANPEKFKINWYKLQLLPGLAIERNFPL